LYLLTSTLSDRLAKKLKRAIEQKNIFLIFACFLFNAFSEAENAENKIKTLRVERFHKNKSIRRKLREKNIKKVE
jgi:hypothetical protein